MKRIDKLILKAQDHIGRREKELQAKERAVYERMTTEQLKELAAGVASEARIREIFAEADGLWLLEV